jgi:hypothetical protein
VADSFQWQIHVFSGRFAEADSFKLQITETDSFLRADLFSRRGSVVEKAKSLTEATNQNNENNTKRVTEDCNSNNED